MITPHRDHLPLGSHLPSFQSWVYPLGRANIIYTGHRTTERPCDEVMAVVSSEASADTPLQLTDEARKTDEKSPTEPLLIDGQQEQPDLVLGALNFSSVLPLCVATRDFSGRQVSSIVRVKNNQRGFGLSQ